MAGTTRPTVGNTPARYYLDNKDVRKACNDDFKTINEKCKAETDADKKKRLKKNKGGIAGLLSKLKGNRGSETNKDARWINDHCEFLMIKPASPKELFDELQGLPKKLASELGKDATEIIIKQATDNVTKAIEKRVAEIMLKKGVMKLAGRGLSAFTGPFAIIINVAMTAYDIYDAQATYKDVVKEFQGQFKQIKENITKLADINKQIDELKAIVNGNQYKKADGSISPEKIVSDLMYAAAEINNCISARRCLLVPFKETNQGVGKNNGKGCCPGQSGHHILPSSMFKNCPKYDQHDAPTICVEGTKNWAGSHKRIHDKLKKRLEDIPGEFGKDITMDQAVNAGTKSVEDAFPNLPPPSKRGCKPECIKEQLKAYYDKLGCTPKKTSGAAGGDSQQQSGGSNNS